MNIQFVALFSMLSLASSGLAQQTHPPAEFLRLLMHDPSQVPAYGEGLRVMDQISTMTPADVRSTVPVIFEAVRSPNQMAQLQAGLALYAIALRPDGAKLLDSRSDEILGLLQHRENRLKTTGVIVAERMNIPAAKLDAEFLRFLGDETQPAEVKPGVVFALVRKGPLSADSARRIGEFLKSRAADISARNDTLNAIASQPNDDPVHADLIIIGLRDPDQSVRNNALHLLRRLGPNAVKRASSALLQIAHDPNETPDLRALAKKLITANQ